MNQAQGKRRAGRRILGSLLVLSLSATVAATALGVSGIRFSKPKVYRAKPSPVRIAAGDFDRDKRLDLAVSDFGGGPGEVPSLTIMKGKSRGRFKPVQTFPAVLQPDGIVATRIDGDSELDLVVGGFTTGKIAVYPGGPGMEFGPPSEYEVGDLNSAPRWVATGDFNADGRADIAASNQSSEEIDVLIASPGGGFEPVVHYPAGASGQLIAARVNRDKRPDLVLPDWEGRRLLVYLARSDGTFASPVPQAAGILPVAVAAADINGDRRTDLIATGLDRPEGTDAPARRRGGSPSDPSSVTISLGKKSGGFKRPKRFRIARAGEPGDLAVGRFDGDKRLDVAVTMRFSNQLAVLAGTKPGRLGKARLFGTHQYPMGILGGRFDADKRTDLAVAESGNDTVSVYLSRSK